MPKYRRVVLAVVATAKLLRRCIVPTGRGASPDREVTVTKGTRRRGEHGIRRQTIAQGRPSVRRHLYAAVRSPCATLSRSGPRVPVGTRSSLRPLHEGGDGNEQNSGVWCRENADSCILLKMEWCCQTGLNCRPLHYQWSALPLSYGSMCWDKNRPPEGPTKPADICHRPPRCASLQGRPKRENRGDIGDIKADLARNDRLSDDFGSASPGQLASWPVRQIRPILSFARSGPRGPLELPHSLGMLSPIAVLDPEWLTRTTEARSRRGDRGTIA